MNFLKSVLRAGVLAMAWVCATPLPAHAQLPAAQQASIIVPYPAGSAFDITARQVQQELGKSLSKTIIVENFGGASGSIGAQRLLSSDPTHLTMLLASSNELALPPLMLSGVKYKPEDFRLVAHMTTGVLAIMARSDFPASNIGELIVAGRQPGAKPISIANVGLGSIFHVAAADFGKRTGVQVTHVPYKGGAPIMQDLMGRQVDMTILPLIPAYTQAALDKKIKVLAILDPKRHSALPDVVSVDEVSGLQGLHYSMWTGLFVSAKVPVAAAEIVGKAANAIAGSPAFRGWVEGRGNSTGTVMELDAAAQFYKRESDRFQKIASDIGLERQ